MVWHDILQNKPYYLMIVTFALEHGILFDSLITTHYKSDLPYLKRDYIIYLQVFKST